MRKTYAWGAIYRVSDRSMPLPALLISEIQQGRPILLVLRVLSFAPVEPNAVSGIQPFENDLGGAMRQLGAIGVGPVVLTGMAVDQGPRSNQSLCKMRIKRQLVLVVGKLEIPRVKPACRWALGTDRGGLLGMAGSRRPETHAPSFASQGSWPSVGLPHLPTAKAVPSPGLQSTPRRNKTDQEQKTLVLSSRGFFFSGNS